MALEVVGGALLSAFLGVAFEKLGSPQVLDLFRRTKLDENLLSKLKIKLHSIDALADDAEQKQFRDPRVRAWLVAAKDVVLDAEDLLDEIQYELSRCEMEAESESQTCTCKVPNFFKSSPISSFNKEIQSRMEEVLANLEFLSNQQGALGLKNTCGVGVVGSGFGSEVSQKSPSTSLVVESVIYGRDDDKEIVFNWLTSDIDNRNKLSILSIVGMGGLGKTTLAQHVYNDPRIEGKFDIKAWVCVSEEFDVFNVTRTILEAITKSTDDSRNREMVQGRLKEKLTGKRFLLVLDDVWNRKQKEWKDLQTPLNDGAQGSKVVVTTRDMKVASVVGSNKIHHLRQLQGDDCWNLFMKHAFQDDNHQPNPDCKETGLKIVAKCKGLPLALTTIGSLLHQKSSISEWRRVLKSEMWEFSEEDSDIVPALALSYHHLPSHLKRCFALCALFPKDYKFDKWCLIQLWMTDNFLRCRQQSKSPEEVGAQYFNDLFSRSFFQQSNFRGKIYFVMHDLVHDLAKYVCGDICFRFEVDQEKIIPKTTRHFSVAIDQIQHFNGFGTLYDTKRLRTFLLTSERMANYGNYRWHCKMSIRELFSKFKLLRFLSLFRCSSLTEVPDFVGDLKHLRMLELSETEINKLPESICSLYNLEILKLNKCPRLKELPSNLFKLTNLRRLELVYTELRKVPAQLLKLKNLQVSMSSFDVGKSREFTIQQLGELNLHGWLSISMLQNIEDPSDAVAVKLRSKTHLIELELQWDLGQNHNDSMKEKDVIVIENLQPSKHLEILTIRNYGGKQFPCWLSNNSLWNMVCLNLINCKSCQCLPRLGQLPFLKNLKVSGLDGIVGIDADFYGSTSSSFTSLETLEFSFMKELENWECQAVTGAFPRLEHLHMVRCGKLKGHLPEQLLHLKKLEIYDCNQLVASAPKALEIFCINVRDCGKLQFDYHPTTLKSFTVSGESMDASLLESSRQIISDNSLEYLSIYRCPNMNIPMSCCYDFLVTLKIFSACDSLTTFPLDFFPTLRVLFLHNCRNLQMISRGHTQNHLKCLRITECPQLESLPERMHILLPSLVELQIHDCPKLESFPDGSLPSNLEKMSLLNGSKLVASLKRAFGANPSLKDLTIGELDLESLPGEGWLPLSITSLHIHNCPNLKRLYYKGLCQLSSLKNLFLQNCPSLQCLPEEGLPKSILHLKISGCPLLKQSQKEETSRRLLTLNT